MKDDNDVSTLAGSAQVPGEAELDDPAALRRLREWAWGRGRTDVLGRLNARDAALDFVAEPTVLRLLRLREVLPVRPRSDWVESAVGELSLGNAERPALEALARNLAPWLALLSWQLVADLEEEAAAPSAASAAPSTAPRAPQAR
jgi:hypothetical protein